MNIVSTLEKAFLEGYATSDLNTVTIFVCFGFTAVIALYICIVYHFTNKSSFYNRSFHLSLFALSIITAAVILTIQSNIVVSLGMVGALSIVRFRTAIKEPMDLVFLFWSITVGIICGAGYAIIAVVGSVILTIGIIVFSFLPAHKDTLVLVVNSSANNESAILNVVSEFCTSWRVRARNLNRAGLNIAIEVRVNDPQQLLENVSVLNTVSSASLVEHNGEVTV